MVKKSWVGVIISLLMIAAGCGGGGSNSAGIPGQGELVAISVTPANASLALNTGEQFIAMGIYSDNSKKDLTTQVAWSSSAPSIAVVTSNTGTGSSGGSGATAAFSISGYVFAKSKGTARIRATSGKISGEAILDVKQASLVSIAVTPTAPAVVKGTSQKFTAVGTFSDNTTQDITTGVVWSSSNTAVATVSNAAGSMGLATSLASGSATITATSGSISASTTLTVNGAQLVAIAVTPTNPAVPLGTATQFAATGTFSDNTTQDLTASVTWSSSNTSIATISSAGLATARAAGSTTVTATSGNVFGSTTLAVNPASLVSLAITPTNPSIAKGTKQQFTATGTFSDNTTHDLTASVNWTSSNTAVATISNAAGSDGLATSVAAGTTTIAAASGSISASTTLTVNPASLVSIAVSPSNPAIAKGTQQQLTATGTYSDGSTQNLTASVTWSSSSTSVATISNAAGSNGLATSVAAGSTTIRAASGSTSGSTTLTVNPASLVSIAVSPSNPAIAKSTKQQFTATGTYADGSIQNLTASVTWSSSSTSVATISNAAGSNGLATSVAAGTTTITATSGAVSASTTLTVNPAVLTSLAISPANPTGSVGGTVQLTATGTYSDGSTQNLTASVTWSSSNTSVATISNAAGSKGLATGVTAGSTSIGAVSGSISASTTLTVSVGTATLAWNAATTNTDGTPLTNLAGYKIYYGTSSGNYSMTINAGNVTSYAVTNLAPGTYYFAVTTLNTSGVESGYSNQVSKIVQ